MLSVKNKVSFQAASLNCAGCAPIKSKQAAPLAAKPKAHQAKALNKSA
jgi:hypothetical protein